ncbi:MAG: ammonium transporter [Planctomycetes bacterium]|nr:ammonium transporter [Planctomycetota bacterium]
MFRSVLCACAAILLLGGVLRAEEPTLTPPPAVTTAVAAVEPAAEPAAAEDPALVEARTAALAVDPLAQAKATAAAGWFGTYTTAPDKSKGEDYSPINNGDNAWLIVASALVLLMTAPGLALFYGGLVRRKNVLGTLMHSFVHMGVVSVIWCTFGFAVAFGGANAFWGGLSDFVMLKDVAWSAGWLESGSRFPISYDYAPTINFGIFCMFQLMFAIITPALICGAYAERIKFSGMLLFNTLWLVLIYLPLAHMVWGKAGLFNWGFGAVEWAAFDFAGGTVVHISSGVAALMCAIFLGKRKGFPNKPMPPHSLVLSFIGAAMLWVGWFGFNAGSALGANGLAVLAFVNTHIAAAAAAITWPLAEWLIRGKPTMLGAISGAVAGLVAITPACGFVQPGSALIIGAIAGALCFASTSYLKRALGYDDALDAFGVHGVGGIFGAIATGIFFSPDANPNIPALNQILYYKIISGDHPVVFNQIKAVVVTVLLSGVGSAVLLTIVKYTVGLRVTDEDEDRGLDLTQHGEEGYHDAA